MPDQQTVRTPLIQRHLEKSFRGFAQLGTDLALEQSMTIAKMTALVLVALAMGGCSGHSETTLGIVVRALDVECLHTEFLYSDLAKFDRNYRRIDALAVESETVKSATREYRTMTEEIVQIFSRSPGRYEELARVARELLSATAQAQAAMDSREDPPGIRLEAAAAAIRRMRELRAKLSTMAPAGMTGALPKA